MTQAQLVALKAIANELEKVRDGIAHLNTIDRKHAMHARWSELYMRDVDLSAEYHRILGSIQ